MPFIGLVLNSTHQDVLAQLAETERQLIAEQHRADGLEQRNMTVMPTVRKGRQLLDIVFHGITDVPVTGQAASHELRYAAKSGLANLVLTPSNGYLLISDPAGQVRSIRVSLDTEGGLDTDELDRIDVFLQQVSWSRSTNAVDRSRRVSINDIPERDWLDASNASESVPIGIDTDLNESRMGDFFVYQRKITLPQWTERCLFAKVTNENLWSYRLTVRTSGSHPDNPGSIPGKITKEKSSGHGLDFFL